MPEPVRPGLPSRRIVAGFTGQPEREEAMRAIRSVAAALLVSVALAGCAAQGAQAPAKVIVGKEAWAAFEAHKAKISHGRGGFALTTSGRGWGESWCSAEACKNTYVATALKYCEQNALDGTKCFIFAIDGEPQVPFEVAN
jgi:hypothetical protein